MTSLVDPAELSNVTNGVNGLVAASIPCTRKLVTWGVEHWVLRNDESAGQVPIARLGARGDLRPDLVRLLGGRLSDVGIAIEFTAVFSSCEGRKERGYAEFKHPFCRLDFLIYNIIRLKS